MANDVRTTAVFLILLIGGGECWRLKQQSRAIPVMGTVVQAFRSADFGMDSGPNGASQFYVSVGGRPAMTETGIRGAVANTFAVAAPVTSEKDWWPSWWGAGSEACRADTDTQTWTEWWHNANATLDGQQMVERYDYKMLKLQILIGFIKRQNCTAGCFASWKQAQERLRQLESCKDLMRPDAIGSPPEFSSQEIRETAAVKFSELGRDAIHVIKAHGYLQPTENCGFYFENLNFANAMAQNETLGADSEFRRHMFGENCDEESKAEWLKELDPSQAEFVLTLEEEFEKQAEALQQGTLPAEVHLETKVKRIIESGRADPKEVMGSLIQVEQGTDVAFFYSMFAVILSIVFGIVIFCIIMFVLYMFVVVSLFSAVGSSSHTRPPNGNTGSIDHDDDDVPEHLPASGHEMPGDTDSGTETITPEPTRVDSGGGAGHGGRQYTEPSGDTPPHSAASSFGVLAVGFCFVSQFVLM